MLAIAAESSLPAARLHRARADSRRGSGASSAEYKHRARRGPRRSAFGKSAPAERLASDAGFYLFDGIDHPLRIRQGATTAYYELDLAFNVRRLRASGGVDLGGYRYSAFGQTKSDTAVLAQPLRWKGRWFSSVAGGAYDVRARQWAPEAAAFLSADEFSDTDVAQAFDPFGNVPATQDALGMSKTPSSIVDVRRSGFGFHDRHSTLWAWPGQSPVRHLDPSGHEPYRDPKPLPDDVQRCVKWAGQAGSRAREICCKWTCGRHYAQGSEDFSSCYERCNPAPKCE